MKRNVKSDVENAEISGIKGKEKRKKLKEKTQQQKGLIYPDIRLRNEMEIERMMRKDEVKSVAEMPKISEVKRRSIKKIGLNQ